MSVAIMAVATIGLVPLTVNAAKCGGVDTSIIDCPDQPGGKKLEESGIWGILMLVVNILSAGVGIAAIGGIVYASIMYTTSAGSPDKVKQAKMIIFNVVVGLIAYAFLWSFLNYITPGGMFH